MKRFLNAWSDAPALLQAIHRDLHVRGVRFGADVGSLVEMNDLVAPVRDEGLEMLLIIKTPGQLEWVGMLNLPDAELWNEPNLKDYIAPADYVALLEQLKPIADSYGIRLWAGGVSNIVDKSPLDYLKALNPALRGRPVAWHGYGGPKAQDFARLKDITQGSKFFCTEWGNHTAPQSSNVWWKRLFRIRERWSDDRVAAMARDTWRLHEEWGNVASAMYQLNDGPLSGTEREDSYGIRHYVPPEGGVPWNDWKPSARTFADRVSEQEAA